MRSDSTTKTRPKQSDAPILPLAQSLRLAVMRLARRLRQQSEPDMTPSMLSALSTIEREIPQEPERQKAEIGRAIRLLADLKKKVLV